MNYTLKPEVLGKWPPGGWRYIQRLSDGSTWNAPNPLANSFRQQVANILEWRRKNPVVATKLNLSVDAAVIAQELIDQTVVRLLAMPRGDAYLVATDAPISTRSINNDTGKKKAFSDSIWSRAKKLGAAAVGAKDILTDWLGDGGVAVPHELAEQRASICAVCPKNTKDSWTRHFTGPVAAGISKFIEVKNGMKLSTSHDAELGICEPCDCVLDLKVHAPLKHILNNTEWNTIQKLDPSCWITHEAP